MMQGYNLEDITPGVDETLIRQPLGVVAAIVPFNFPAMIPFWFLPYAIACGNTFVLKPSERVPLTVRRTMELIEKTGIPKGVVNIVNGGRDVVDALCDHPAVRAISFVGSTPVAKHVYQRSAAAGKRMQCQGGAKNHVIVLPDADMDLAKQIISDSAFGCAGQRCLALSVVIGVGGAYSKLERMLVEALRSDVTLGYGLEPGVTMGPLVSARHKERVLAYIDKGVREGAKLVVDGRGLQVPGLPKGHWVGPTLFTGVRPEMTIGHEEIFGPVLCVIEAKDVDEALRIVKSHPLANASSIYTSNGAHARKYCKEVDASMVGVNIGVAAPLAMFGFGGAKGSFLGDLKAHGREQVQFYTQNKTSIVRWW